jgi:hypothetical protein
MKSASRRGPVYQIATVIGVLGIGLALPTGARATTYLDAQGGVSALPNAGGVVDGYHQTLSPVTSPTVASGSAQVDATRPPFTGIGPDLYGSASASSSASFGALQQSAGVVGRNYGASVSAGDGGSAAFAQDLIVIHGSGTIEVTVYSELIGATAVDVASNAAARVRSQVGLSPSGYTDNGQIIALTSDFSGNAQFDSVQLQTIHASDGNTLYLTASLNQQTSEQLLNAVGLYPQQSASTTSWLIYWVTLSPAATLTSESGWSYSAPVTAVPEPAPAALLLTGLLVLGLPRRLR